MTIYDYLNGVMNQYDSPVKYNIIEQDDMFEIEIALPGLTKESITLKKENNKLILKTDFKSDKKYVRQEFDYSFVNKTFNLPNNIEKVSSKYENGILYLRLIKSTKDISNIEIE